MFASIKSSTTFVTFLIHNEYTRCSVKMRKVEVLKGVL